MEVATKATGASLREARAWHSINWKQAHRNVRRLQVRIVKAIKEGKKRKVRALQRILTRSFSGKAMAVKRVTTNQGKQTSGVDNILWDTPEKKAKAIVELQRRGYHPLPLKRVAIPKPDGSQRFLGIPTLKDRAMQALHLLSLDPVAETLADPNSYGFRPQRSAADALVQCANTLSHKNSATWVLEGDIKACFDCISHQWLIKHIPMDKAILQKWLKAGYVNKNRRYETDCGTPQGGIISPVLANLTLDGLEQELKERFALKGKRQNKVNLIRYADDFIITGRTKELLENEVKPVVEKFLKPRGLELSKTKTQIVHIEEGFDFLGQTHRKYKGKFLARPSAKNTARMFDKVRTVIKGNWQAKVGELIGKLNPIIKGWATYHRHAASKQTFKKVEWHILKMTWRWMRRKHPKKNAAWIKKKYYQRAGNQRDGLQAEFLRPNAEKKRVQLYQVSKTVIKRHTKVKASANPYDCDWEFYFEERIAKQMVESLQGKRKLLKLWQEQEGKCVICDEKVTRESGWNLHHIRKRVEGGTEEMENLVLLHPNCHRQVHSQDWQVRKPRAVKSALAKA